MSTSGANVVWWDFETIDRERELFVERFGDLEGITNTDLRNVLGTPDEIVPGGSRTGNENGVTLVADSLRYYSLLPHTIVAIALYDGVVHHFYFMPKVKQCSAELQGRLGKVYAPDK